MQELLTKLGLKKVELARALGIRPGTVYRWTDETCPRHVLAYLELRVRYEQKEKTKMAEDGVLPSSAVPSGGVDDDKPEEVHSGSTVPVGRGRRPKQK